MRETRWHVQPESSRRVDANGFGAGPGVDDRPGNVLRCGRVAVHKELHFAVIFARSTAYVPV